VAGKPISGSPNSRNVKYSTVQAALAQKIEPERPKILSVVWREFGSYSLPQRLPASIVLYNASKQASVRYILNSSPRVVDLVECKKGWQASDERE
jgi:uncharacterized phage-associated protein